MAYKPGDMTEEQATELLNRDQYFDYLESRLMKVRIGATLVDTFLYDRDLGNGAGYNALLEYATRPEVKKKE